MIAAVPVDIQEGDVGYDPKCLRETPSRVPRDLGSKILNPGGPPYGLVGAATVGVRAEILGHPNGVTRTNDQPPVEPRLSPRTKAATGKPQEIIAPTLKSANSIISEPTADTTQAALAGRELIGGLRRNQKIRLHRRVRHSRSPQARSRNSRRRPRRKEENTPSKLRIGASRQNRLLTGKGLPPLPYDRERAFARALTTTSHKGATQHPITRTTNPRTERTERLPSRTR